MKGDLGVERGDAATVTRKDKQVSLAALTAVRTNARRLGGRSSLVRWVILSHSEGVLRVNTTLDGCSRAMVMRPL